MLITVGLVEAISPLISVRWQPSVYSSEVVDLDWCYARHSADRVRHSHAASGHGSAGLITRDIYSIFALD